MLVTSSDALRTFDLKKSLINPDFRVSIVYKTLTHVDSNILKSEFLKVRWIFEDSKPIDISNLFECFLYTFKCFITENVKT